MPFISIQSFFRRVAVVPQLPALRITNWIYDNPVNVTDTQTFGYSEISDDGTLMIAGAPRTVNIYQRLTGPNTPWTLMQSLAPPTVRGSWKYDVSYSTGDKVYSDLNVTPRWFIAIQDVPLSTIDLTNTAYWQVIPGEDFTYGEAQVCISGDGTRVAFGSTEGNTLSTERGKIYVYRLSAGSWVLEDELVTSRPAISIPLSEEYSFNTSTAIDATNNFINAGMVHGGNDLLDIEYPLTRVRYTTTGSDNIGLVNGTEYWAAVDVDGIVFFQGSTKPRMLRGGTWDGDITYREYEPGDYAKYSGVWYKCIQNTLFESTTPPPSAPAYWTTANVLVDLTAGSGETNHYLSSTWVYSGLNTITKQIFNGAQQPQIPSIKMNGDGSTLVTNKFIPGGARSALTVFVRTGTTWNEEQTIPLVAPDDSPYVHVYTRTAGVWTLQSDIVDPNYENLFPLATDETSRGASCVTASGALAISNIGDTIAVGVRGVQAAFGA